jgi:hypothetical protein
MNHPDGWNCDAVGGQLDRYLLHDMRLVERLAIAEHLEACALCSERVMFLRVSVLEARPAERDEEVSHPRRSVRNGKKRGRGGRHG